MTAFQPYEESSVIPSRPPACTLCRNTRKSNHEIFIHRNAKQQRARGKRSRHYLEDAFSTGIPERNLFCFLRSPITFLGQHARSLVKSVLPSIPSQVEQLRIKSLTLKVPFKMSTKTHCSLLQSLPRRLRFFFSSSSVHGKSVKCEHSSCQKSEAKSAYP